jgi:translation initiation factor IF-2
MRARGARVTDVAVLVVAADDGVMPQTVEAIDHVKAADVPIIVAINKVDRPNSDPERIKRQLSEHDLIVEDWGGDVISVPVSALRKEGIDDLLANILVVSEVAELKANPNREAKGVVVEARLDKSRGPVATVLVQTGTLEVGNIVVAGGARGRVKAMLDDSGGRIRESGPSTPVEILGLDGLPPAGQSFEVAPDEKRARAMVADWEDDRARSSRVSGVTLEDVHAKIESGEVMALDLIVKTDVQGSIDAIRSALEALRTDDTRVNLIHIATGSITDSDVMLAAASNAVIVGFRSEPQPGARAFANQEGVDVRYYDVIYNLIDEIEMALAGLLAPVVEDIVEGYATVRALFQLGRGVRAAGIFVNEGQITRRAEIHVARSGRKVFTGQIGSLKHFRDDVRELTAGNEGGIVLEGFRDFQEGDVLESHVTRQAE